MANDDVVIAKSYKRDVINAIGDLVKSNQSKVVLKHPNSGQYVSYEKPRENSGLVLAGAYDLKNLSLSNDSQMVYHIIDNPMGPSE